MTAICLGFAAAAAFGWLATGLLWPAGGRPPALWPLRLVLSCGLGIGLTSGLFFLWSSLADPGSRWYWALEGTLLVILMGVAAARRRFSPETGDTTGTAMPASSPARFGLLGAVSLLSLGGAAATWVLQAKAFPHGGWDAWSTWNLLARILSRGREHWVEQLRLLRFDAHPDYPLLLPASVARNWNLSGDDSILGPVCLAHLFALLLPALLFAGVRHLRGTRTALFAAVVLLGCQTFLLHASMQYADIPLAFFMLGTVLLAGLADEPASAGGWFSLAGLCGGLAAWTKNEGGLFLAAFTAAWLWVQRGERRNPATRRRLAWFALGALPLLALVVAFKAGVAPPVNEIASQSEWTDLPRKLLDPARHLAILAAFGRQLLQFGNWAGLSFLPLLFFLGLLAGPAEEPRPAGLARRTWITVGLMLVFDYGIFLITPMELQWHLNNSLDRLILQLWPLVLLAFCLSVRVFPAPNKSAPAGADS